MRCRRLVLAIVATLACPGGGSRAAGPPGEAAPAPPDRAGVEFFEKDVRPLLVERCYPCHSAGAKKIKGGLRLDSRAALLRGGDQGPAAVPAPVGIRTTTSAFWPQR